MELQESYDELIDKVYSWLQAEETAFEGRPVTFMDNRGGKPQKGRPWEESRRKNKESHDTNTCRELKSQTEEAVRLGKLAYLIKGIRKKKAKQADAQLREWIALTVKVKQAAKGKQEPILMIGMVNNPLKSKEPLKIMSIEEKVFSPIRNRAPFIDPILIIVQVYGIHVGRVLLDRGAAYDIIYKHCFLKLRK
uniref:Reverse transcriptase domain-containing protein n=1 Tax=Tanacetum cinerariifolium TaxID=118510 RepID=A0A699H9Q6_TANCI|nr:hypothetical protein [Tanacetum cinerariifolium]